MPDCPYCNTESQTDGELTAHLEDAHSREELSRIDRKRVEKHAADSGARSRLGRVVPDGRLSRRAALVGAGTVLAGIGVGIGSRMSQSSPTPIQNWTDLDDVRTGLSDDYVLANDLDQSTTGYSGTGDDFDPIGDTGNRFQGTFDGNGHTISDLTIEVAFNQSGPLLAGLFGATDGSAEIKNLTIAGANVTYEDRLSDGDGGAFIIGANAGTVRNVSASGSLEAVDADEAGCIVGLNTGTVRNVSASDSLVVDDAFKIGGVVGLNKGIITGSVSDATLSKTGGNVGDVGGLVGKQEGGTVEDCVATGKVSVEDTRIGGLVGTNDPVGAGGSVIRDSHATGDVVNGTGDAGGLVGSNQDAQSIIERCYATGTVSSSGSGENFGGLVGENPRGAVRESYATGKVDASNAAKVGGLVGDNTSGARITESYATGAVTGANRTGGLAGFNENSVVRTSYATGAVTGANETGGLVGRNEGQNPGGTITKSFATGAVEGDNQVGGLLGRNQNGGSNATRDGGLVEDTYAQGAVTGNDEVGGIAGVNRAEFGPATVRRSYATGSITGSNSGGLVGRNEGTGGNFPETATVENSYWDTQTTGKNNPIGTSVSNTAETGLNGLRTADMQGTAARTNMSAFDFNSIWTAVVAGQQINPTPEEDGYPILGALDVKQQLGTQGIGLLQPGIKIDGADNVTLDNVTIDNDN